MVDGKRNRKGESGTDGAIFRGPMSSISKREDGQFPGGRRFVKTHTLSDTFLERHTHTQPKAMSA